MTSALIQLKAHLKDSAAVGKAAALLEWDKEVMMPPDLAREDAADFHIAVMSSTDSCCASQVALASL